MRRVARRIILGDGAGPDERLSEWLGELMDKSNPPGGGDESLYKNLLAALGKHVNAAEEGSLAALFAQAPQGEHTDPAGQVIHWLFALGDTLAINALRCLALLAVFNEERARALADPGYMDACLHEAMRLWPTTAMLSRETTREVDWDGVKVPAGTQLVIVNAFNHRDRSRHEFADRFAPIGVDQRRCLRGLEFQPLQPRSPGLPRRRAVAAGRQDDARDRVARADGRPARTGA